MMESALTNSGPQTTPRDKMRAIFEEISSPINESACDSSSKSTKDQPLQDISVHDPTKTKPAHSDYSVVPPYKPASQHDRLHSDDWVEAPRAIGKGSNLMAYFDDETVTRTRYELLIEGHDGHGNTAHAILEARMTLSEICEEYPQYVTGSSLLLVFSCEGWSPQLIWNNIPREVRESSPGDCPWQYIDVALQRHMDRLAAAEVDAEGLGTGIEVDEEASETQEIATPKSRNRHPPKGPKWTATDDATLLDLKSSRKTHKEIGAILGRSEMACSSRLNKLRKAQEAAAANNSGQAAGTASDPVEVEDAALPGGQVDNPMVLD